MRAEDNWPACSGCQMPMTLFLQLDLETVPPVLQGKFGAGLLQLFYATCSAFGVDPVTRRGLILCSQPEPRHFVRVLHPDVDGVLRSQPDGKGIEPQAIMGWTPKKEHPGMLEYARLGYWEYFSSSHEQNDESDFNLSVQFPGLSGDKLDGWPYWLDFLQYPSCPTCGKPMALAP